MSKPQNLKTSIPQYLKTSISRNLKTLIRIPKDPNPNPQSPNRKSRFHEAQAPKSNP